VQYLIVIAGLNARTCQVSIVSIIQRNWSIMILAAQRGVIDEVDSDKVPDPVVTSKVMKPD
jgi:hypothetical protein